MKISWDAIYGEGSSSFPDLPSGRARLKDVFAIFLLLVAVATASPQRAEAGGSYVVRQCGWGDSVAADLSYSLGPQIGNWVCPPAKATAVRRAGAGDDGDDNDEAGTYTVRQCGWGDNAGAGWGWYYNGSPSFQAGESICPGEGLAMWSQGGLEFGSQNLGIWQVNAPSDVAILYWAMRGRQWHNGLFASMQACNGGGCELAWGPQSEEWSCIDYEDTDGGAVGTFNNLRINYHGWDSEGGGFVPFCDGRIRGSDFEILAYDYTRPWFDGFSGSLISGGWKRGPQSLYASARDSGSGVRQIGYKVDGSSTEQWYGASCHIGQGGVYDDLSACPSQQWYNYSVDTAAYTDGCHTVAAVAQEATGDMVETGEVSFCSDNTVPGAPEGITTEGGDGWHSSNGFNATLSLPKQAPTGSELSEAPLAALYWRVDSGGWTRQSANVTSINGITVGSPGEHDLQIILEDDAGNHAPLGCACPEVGHKILRLG